MCRKVTDCPAFLIGVHDGIQLFLRDPPDLQKAVRILLHDVEGPCTETLHDQLCGLGPDLLPAVCLELEPVFPLYPSSLQVGFHRIRVGQAVPLCGELCACPRIMRILCLLWDLLHRMEHKDTVSVISVAEYFPHKSAPHLFSSFPLPLPGQTRPGVPRDCIPGCCIPVPSLSLLPSRC